MSRAPHSVLAYPMHGQHKLLAEGYRTRDGHFIEWFGHLLSGRSPVAVVSRPEPLALRRTKPKGQPAGNTVSLSTLTVSLPNPFYRRHWWVRSARLYPRITDADRSTPAVIWNPFTALANDHANPFRDDRTTVLDLLDDWTVHFAFRGIAGEVEEAYAAAFASATYVTANAEGTVALAARFGRRDALLLPNGCDPDRFSTTSLANGPSTVGYVGKIGRRLDLELILATAQALPGVRFVFAGPILDREYRKPLVSTSNIEVLGDVHYEGVPRLLQQFDIGWVPHRVGAGEVGGDVIKTYEYRAAGLPVLTTPIDGAGSRGLDGIVSLAPRHHIGWLKDALSKTPRVARIVSPIPAQATWKHKAERVLDLLQVRFEKES